MRDLGLAASDEGSDEVDEREEDEAGRAAHRTHRGELAVADGDEDDGRGDEGGEDDGGLGRGRPVDLLEQLLVGRRALAAGLLERLDLRGRELDIGRREVALEPVALGRGRDDDGALGVDPGD